SCSYNGGHGNTILVAHKNNFYTRYSHNSENLVKPGDEVKKGQIIALAGSTGNSTGPHLHFEIRFNDIPLNPLDFLPTDEDIVIVKHTKSAPKKSAPPAKKKR
ncbi:MAG: M23 family metallopeptidase, partial [Leptospirales bacterium]|nr:M23 family metallopeptidase [Leptospirales bacterium]